MTRPTIRTSATHPIEVAWVPCLPTAGGLGVTFAPGKHGPNATGTIQWERDLDANHRVVAHCRGGLGRAGPVAACVVTSCGVAPADAIERVRRVRPGAVETRQQEADVAGFAGRTLGT